MNSFESVMTWIFAVIGFATSVIQVWKWIRGRRADRGLEIFLESQVDRKDAEAIRAELSALQERLEDLKLSARSIARRMHLEQRKADLEKTLGLSWSEYKEVIGELSDSTAAPGLPQELLNALVSDIQPRYMAERKEVRRIGRILIALAVVLLLPLPFTPKSVITLAVELLAVSIALPWEIGQVAYIGGPILTIVGVLCGITAGIYSTRRRHVTVSTRRAKVTVICAGAALVIGNIIAGWAVYNSLYWQSGGFGLAVGINITDSVIAGIAGMLLVLGGWLPTRLSPVSFSRFAGSPSSGE